MAQSVFDKNNYGEPPYFLMILMINQAFSKKFCLDPEDCQSRELSQVLKYSSKSN